MGLKDWNHEAGHFRPSASKSVWRSAKRFIELPACS